MTAINQELQGRIKAALERWHQAKGAAEAAERTGDTAAARHWQAEARRRRESVINYMRQQNIPRC